MRTKRKYIESKTGLAKLLANENLSVSHDPEAATAHIDLKNRNVVLPVLANMEGYMYNAFIAHEVSHALHTPFVGWKDFSKDYPAVFLNVTEDARIEKLIKRKYPGLKKDFINFYEELSSPERDFFGISEVPDISKLPLLDRINLHFKIGANVLIPFTTEERYFVNLVDSEETFDDAKNAAIEIYEYMKKNNQLDSITVNVDVTFSSDADSDDDSDDNGNDVQNGTDSDDDSDDGKTVQIKIGETQKSFNESLSNDLFEYSRNNNTFTGDVYDGSHTWKQYIIPYRNILKPADGRQTSEASIYTTETKATVSHIVNRFNMKRSANDYKRIRSSNKGVLNDKKLSMYKTHDNIFLQNEILPDAQNHGLIMFVDFSISMSNMLKDTLYQTLILTDFCKRLQIPFEVYGFTDGTNNAISKENVPSNQIYMNVSVGSYVPRLYHILSSQMKKSEYESAKNKFLSGNHKNGISLSNTPLMSSMFLLEHVVKDFRRRYGIEKISFVLLSDGSGNDDLTNKARNCWIRNPMNGKNYKLDYNTGPFHGILDYVKERTGIHKTLGFYVSNNNHLKVNIKYFAPGYKLTPNDHKLYEVTGSLTIPPHGAFDNFYFVNINKFKGTTEKMVFLNSFVDHIS